MVSLYFVQKRMTSQQLSWPPPRPCFSERNMGMAGGNLANFQNAILVKTQRFQNFGYSTRIGAACSFTVRPPR